MHKHSLQPASHSISQPFSRSAGQSPIHLSLAGDQNRISKKGKAGLPALPIHSLTLTHSTEYCNAQTDTERALVSLSSCIQTAAENRVVPEAKNVASLQHVRRARLAAVPAAHRRQGGPQPHTIYHDLGRDGDDAVVSKRCCHHARNDRTTTFDHDTCDASTPELPEAVSQVNTAAFIAGTHNDLRACRLQRLTPTHLVIGRTPLKAQPRLGGQNDGRLARRLLVQ
mmetsp:Transcript_165/g.442  ORF Transcript_165/g.442 Transcript_165/m.442 type:complete len:226 (+) Transcript_165:231-908(+)